MNRIDPQSAPLPKPNPKYEEYRQAHLRSVGDKLSQSAKDPMASLAATLAFLGDKDDFSSFSLTPATATATAQKTASQSAAIDKTKK